MLSAHPIIGPGKRQIAPQTARLTMAVRGSADHYLANKIPRRHRLAQARQVGLGAASAARLIEEVLAGVEGTADKIRRRLPAGFPPGVAETKLSGLREQAARLME